MKNRKTLFLALVVVFVFVFAASAFASIVTGMNTRARTFNWQAAYYSWGTPSGGGVYEAGVSTEIGEIGANPANPSVHSGYLANTAKCGICHSVHRARGDGDYLLNTAVATCAGCHVTGSTVTDIVINWNDSNPAAGAAGDPTNTGGPHNTGNNAQCTGRACHVSNPHGAGSSQYAIVAQALLNPLTDQLLASAVANPASSGISVNELDMGPGATWNADTRSLVRTGYNCNICHTQSMLAVVQPGWAENRFPGVPSAPTTWGNAPQVSMTGHPGGPLAVPMATTVGGGVGQSAFAPVQDCESCHDQGDTATRSNFTFPHGQEPVGTTNLVQADLTTPETRRSLLWMGWSEAVGEPLQRIEMNLADSNSTMKAYDGNCLKCHRMLGDDPTTVPVETVSGVGNTW